MAQIRSSDLIFYDKRQDQFTYMYDKLLYVEEKS